MMPSVQPQQGVAPTSFSLLPISPFIWGRVFKKLISHYSDLLSSFGILLLDTCDVAARIFPQVPRLAGRGAHFGLSCMSLTYIDFYTKNIVKGYHDCRHSL